MNHAVAIFIITGLVTAGVAIRPWRVPEAVWAVAGAALLVFFGLLSWRDALAGAAKGVDVYLFLTGMMLLAELAREEGLFDWLAVKAARAAGNSPTRLFALVYAVGILVTVFLSNDATAVVLTPAVAAVMRTVKAEEPRPYLLTCAFIANAASFVLPISNPANLVVYGSHMPPLLHWLAIFAAPSALSIAATYLVLRLAEQRRLGRPIAVEVEAPALSPCARLTACGIAATSAILLAASALGFQLGLPTFLAAAATALVVFLCSDSDPVTPIRRISWGILPLVAGLFVLVQALQRTGVIADLAGLLQQVELRSQALAAALSGAALALASNVVNNLPAGLVAERVTAAARTPERIRAAILIGVDLGPNLSVTGSLATILWLNALKREGYRITAWEFLKFGALVMPTAFVLALAAALVSG